MGEAPSDTRIMQGPEKYLSMTKPIDGGEIEERIKDKKRIKIEKTDSRKNG